MTANQLGLKKVAIQYPQRKQRFFFSELLVLNFIVFTRAIFLIIYLYSN